MTTSLSAPISPLISPTKARRDAAQAKDWAYVSSWLLKKYSPQLVPRFERNGETLRELLELVAVNEAADREVELIKRAEEEELRRYEQVYKGDDGPCRNILEALEGSLTNDGTNALSNLAEASILLGTVSPDPIVMGGRMIELSSEKFEMEEQLRRISDLQTKLEWEMEMMNMNTEKIKSEVDQVAQEDMQQRTVQLNRETKQFTTKMSEYSERVATTKKFTFTSPDIAQVKDLEQRVKSSQMTIKALEREVAGFHNLPPDLGVAREEYQRAQSELRNLRQRRDALFQKMVKR
jgi:HAUS augmin-like complex subunit 1